MTKKKWIGKFGYSFEENHEFISFEIEADYSDGSFEGSVFEDEFSNVTSELIHVKGFIDAEMISFVKTYPFYYSIDEKGFTIIDKTIRGHKVIYQGHFNKEDETWNGEWEIIHSEEKISFGVYKTNSLIGPWKMKLQESI